MAGNSERAIYIRLGVKDAEQAARLMEQFGERGQRAVRSVETAAAPASRSLLALNAASGELRQGFTGLASGAGSAGTVLGAIGPAGLAAAAAITVATGAFVALNRAVSSADAMVKFADNVGINVEVLQEFRFAAARSGVDAKQLDVAIAGFNRRIGEARKGTGELLPILKRYGVELADAGGRARATEDIIGDLADVIAATADPFERARIGAKAFGEEAGVRMLNLLKGGSAGLADLREEARRVGVVLEEEFARDAEKARDALDTFGEIISTKINRALLTMAPLVTSVVSGLSDLIVAISNFQLIKGGSPDIELLSVDDLRAQLDEAVAQLDLDLADAANAADEATRDYFRGIAETTRTEIARLRDELARRGGGAAAAVAAAAPAPADLAPYTDAITKLREGLEPLLKLERERREAIDQVTKALQAGAIDERAASELLDQINEQYEENRQKIDGTTEALKKRGEAEKEAAEQARKAAAENARLSDRVNDLRGSYDRTYAALRQYNDEVALLDRALDRGLLSEQAHADLLSRVEEGYRRAKAEAASYGATVNSIPNPSARPLSPVSIGSLLGDLGNFGKSALATGTLPTLKMLGNFAIGQVGGSIFDNLFAGNNPLSGLLKFFDGGQFFSGLTNSFASGLASIAPGLGTSIGQAIGIGSGLGPAGLLTGGLGPGGAGGAVASQIASGGLAQAGFAAALPAIGIAIAGLTLILSKVFGPGKSSGPALGASFEVEDGAVGIRAFGADNKADPEQAKALGDAVVEFTDAFLKSTGGRLLPGAFAGELGFESGRFATAISSPGLTEGDRKSGRSPDLRTFGKGEGAAERATADFVVRSILDALDRGLVEGISDVTAETVKIVLGRLDRDGGAETLAEAGEALDFATGFEDATARMLAAGDEAATQLLDLAAGAKAFGDQQKTFVEGFKGQLDKFFGSVDREVAGSRPDTSAATITYDRNGAASGFALDGASFRRRVTGDEGLQTVQWVNEATGEVIEGARNVADAIERFADQVSTDNPQTVTDFGDPALFTQGMDALSAYIDDVLGLVDEGAKKPLTGAALALVDGLGKIDAMRGALEELGLSAEQVTEKLASAETRLREKVREDFDQATDDAILSIRSPNAAAIVALSEAFTRRTAEAEAVGGNVERVRELYQLQLTELARQDEIARINEGIAARNTEISALEQVATAAEGIAQQAGNTRRNLLYQPKLSYLSPEQQLAAATKEFGEAVEKAKGGDQVAARRATELAATVLQLGQAFNASDIAQAALARAVDDGLAAIEGKFASDAQVARSQLSELTLLRGLAEQQLAALQGSRSGSADPDRSYGLNTGRNRLIADLFPEFTGDFGAGAFGQFRAGLASGDPRLDALAALERVSFAAGGDHLGGIRLVGERGIEIENTGPSRIFSADQTSNMLRSAISGGAETAGLLAAVLAELRRLGGKWDDMAQRLVEVEAANAVRRYAVGSVL